MRTLFFVSAYYKGITIYSTINFPDIYVFVYVYTHTRACKYTQTHTHTHTHTHICSIRVFKIPKFEIQIEIGEVFDFVLLY